MAIKDYVLKPRDIYLKQLIAFLDTEPVKVVTGIRRCGKSSLLKLMRQYLLDHGVSSDQIIFMNFESMEFRKMDVKGFYQYVKERIGPCVGKIPHKLPLQIYNFYLKMKSLNQFFRH